MGPSDPPPSPSIQESSRTRLFLCNNQGSFNIEDSKLLNLTFRYQLYRYESVSALGAASNVKNSMLAHILDTIQCFESVGQKFSLRRRTIAGRENLLDDGSFFSSFGAWASRVL